MKNTKLFNSAFRAFFKKDYSKAGAVFDQLIAHEDTLAWQKIRLKMFKNIVDQKVQSKNDMDSGAALAQVSYCMNLKDYARAEELLGHLELAEDAKTYLRAEIKVEENQTDEAAELLKAAIELNTDNRGFALNSSSFHVALKEDAFSFLKLEEKKA